jgi:hypothetical protein
MSNLSSFPQDDKPKRFKFEYVILIACAVFFVGGLIGALVSSSANARGAGWMCAGGALIIAGVYKLGISNRIP